jgi:fibronectin-binding autotransporter adhesin
MKLRLFDLTRHALPLAIALAAVLATQSARAAALTWNLATGGDWDTITANWAEAPNTFTDAGVDEVTFNNTAGGTITIAPDMSPLSTTVNASSGTYIFSGGPIDSGTLTKSGAGILTLAGANSFSGVTLSAGQLNINDAGALGTGMFTISGGTLDSTAGSGVALSTVTPQAWNGNFIWNATKNLNLGTGTVTFSGTRSIGISAAGSAATLTVGGNIAGAFGLTLMQRNPASNPKVVALTGSNTYTGNTAGANFGNGVATLRADDGIGLPGGSLLALTELVIETGTDLMRPSGNSAGHFMRVAQAGSSTGASGFSAYGGPVNVAFGTSLGSLENLTWGSTNFNPGNNARGLILNEKTANNSLDFRNNINLNTQTGIVIVNATHAAAIATMSGVLSGTGTSGLKKNGVGTLVLTGANTYDGATTVSAGTLVARNASAFGDAPTNNVSVAANAGLIYVAAADSPLAIGGTLSITGGTSTRIGGSIGSTTTSARIEVAGNATTTASAIKVDIYGSGSSTSASDSGNYTLIHGGGSNTLNNATYTLGMVYNNTNFTVDASPFSASTADDLTVAITQQAALTGNVFWNGTLTTGVTKVWAASDGGSDSNWATDMAGTTTALVPGAAANIVISVTAPTVAPIGTTLGANMTIRSLTIADTTNGLGLNNDGNTLTLSPASATAGITMDTGVPASLIATPVALDAAQTWTNNSENPLTVSGTIGGRSVKSRLTTAGTGTVILSGANTYTGTTTIQAGTLQLGHNLALRNSVLDPSGAGTLAFSAGINTPTFGGLTSTTNLTLASNVTALTLNPGTAVTATYSGGLASATAGMALIKTGAGTQVFSGNNTYSGTTTVNAGTLNLKAGSLANTAIAVTGTGILAVKPGSATTVSAGNTATAGAGASLNLGAKTFEMTDGFATTFNLVQESTFADPALTITSGATLNFDLGATGADLLAVTKTAAVSGTVTVTLDTSGASSLTTGICHLVTAESGLSGGTWQFTDGSTQTVMVGGNSYKLTLNTSDTAISVTVATGGSAYDTWASGLANPAFDFDSDHNGIANGLQWILGGSQTESNVAAIAPLETLDATALQLTFKRVDASVAETTLTAEWDVDLVGTWTSVPINQTAAGTYNLPNGVTVTVVTHDAAPDDITVRIPRSNAVGDKLFARLKATQP